MFDYARARARAFEGLQLQFAQVYYRFRDGIILASNVDVAKFSTLCTQQVTIVWFWYINPLRPIVQSP